VTSARPNKSTAATHLRTSGAGNGTETDAETDVRTDTPPVTFSDPWPASEAAVAGEAAEVVVAVAVAAVAVAEPAAEEGFPTAEAAARKRLNPW
jgi:hypothetical protein